MYIITYNVNIHMIMVGSYMYVAHTYVAIATHVCKNQFLSSIFFKLKYILRSMTVCM